MVDLGVNSVRGSYDGVLSDPSNSPDVAAWDQTVSNAELHGGSAPSQVAPPSTIGGATLSGGEKHIDPSAPVPLVDDQGKPVLDSQGRPLLRPAGLDPHFFVNQGVQDKQIEDALVGNGGGLGVLSYEAGQLYKFKQGGAWDAQRIGGKFHPEYVDYATVAIGLYGAANGFPKNELLSIQNAYAGLNSHYPPGTIMDKTYTHLPARNVANTDLGYQLYQSGRIHATATP